MPPSTRRKLLQPHKHTPSEKICDNLSKATKTIVKRVPKGKFIHPDNALEEVHESDPEPIEPIPQPIVDVSSVKFTLSWSILLDGVEIDNDSDLLILGEFNYRDFNANAIKTMTRATTKAKVDFEYIKGSAMLGAKGVTKLRNVR